MGKVIPTVFARSRKEFDDRFAKLIGVSKEIQIDFMDGKFVKTKSIGLKEVPDLRKYKNNFEAHLMVFGPEKWISSLRKKGFGKVIFHYEAVNQDKISNIIDKIKKARMKVFIGINPETSVSEILPFLNEVDGVLVMGVHPGKEHQNFIEDVYGKIAKLRRFNKKLEIEVDGGVNFDNVGKLASLGANYINSGSLVADSENPAKNLKKLKEMFRKS